MGFATIDPHSQKEHTEIYKILKFGVNQASTTSKLTKECMVIRHIRTLPDTSVQLSSHGSVQLSSTSVLGKF